VNIYIRSLFLFVDSGINGWQASKEVRGNEDDEATLQADPTCPPLAEPSGDGRRGWRRIGGHPGRSINALHLAGILRSSIPVALLS